MTKQCPSIRSQFSQVACDNPKPASVAASEPASDSQDQREAHALTLAPGSTKLVRLWRRAGLLQEERSQGNPAGHGAANGVDFDPAWEQLTEALSPFIQRRLRVLLRRLDSRRFEPDEVMQEVYLRLLQRGAIRMTHCAAHYDAQLVAYIGRVCDSVVTDLRRRTYALKRGVDVTFSIAGGGPEYHEDPSQNPQRDAQCRSELRQFRRAVGECARKSTRHPARTRWIMEETLMYGRRSAELAKPLGVSSSSINSVVSRMRRSLREEGWNIAHQPTS